MFFTVALRDATSGSPKQWRVIAWHKRVPTAVTRLLSPRYSASQPSNSDTLQADQQGKQDVDPRAYFVRSRQQALRNVVTYTDAKGTKWQIDTTPINTCVLPPKPGEQTDGMPAFQMQDATQSPAHPSLLKGMKSGQLPIRLVRAGTALPIGFALVEQSFEGRRVSDYHFRPIVPVTTERYNAALKNWMKNFSESISYEQLRKDFPSSKR